jgi:butyrate kinase
MQNQVVIVINPGSTSTKMAIYNRDGEITSETIRHKQSELDKFVHFADQLDYRYNMINKWVECFLEGKDYKLQES